MIARTWHGRTPTAQAADDYLDHLRDAVVPALESLTGFQGICLLRRETDAGTDFEVITFWKSLAAIHGFAGDSPERAVVEAAARELLSDFDEEVEHHEVVLSQLR